MTLDTQGQGATRLDVTWERVTALIPKASKTSQGVWETCTAFLTEEDGQTLLVATGGRAETSVTVFVQVLNTQSLLSESACCH